MKIKKDDQILVIAGKDKGKKGKVQRALPVVKKITVEDIQLVKKHIRARKEGEKGQVIQISQPLSVSNVALICPHCKKSTRVGYRLSPDGKKPKVRFCKKCQKAID